MTDRAKYEVVERHSHTLSGASVIRGTREPVSTLAVAPLKPQRRRSLESSPKT